MDLRPPLSLALDAFGVDALVAPPSGPSVETTAFWLPSETEEVPSGGDLRRAEQKRVVVLPRADVPEVPRGTVITMAEADGGAPVDWKVDSADKHDYDHHRVVVLPA